MQPLPSAEEIKKAVNDTSKVSEAIGKIKKNRKLVPQTIEMIKKNPEIERNMSNLTRELTNGGVMGTETPLKERKKMAHRQELIRSQMKNKIVEGDVKCALVLVNGKITSQCINMMKIESEEKWCVDAIEIKGEPFIYVCDSTSKISNKYHNKKASELLGVPVYGLVSFIKLDSEYEPVDCTVKDLQ